MNKNTQHIKALFDVGQIVATPGALDLLDKTATNAATLLQRHVNGDWGDLAHEDKAANDEAVSVALRIFSSYKLDGHKLWIITEADRSATTLLLPSEY